MFFRISVRSSFTILFSAMILLALAFQPILAQEETPPDSISLIASDGTEAPVSDIHPSAMNTAGTLWSNGPADQVNGVTSIDPPNAGKPFTPIMATLGFFILSLTILFNLQ